MTLRTSTERCAEGKECGLVDLCSILARIAAPTCAASHDRRQSSADLVFMLMHWMPGGILASMRDANQSQVATREARAQWCKLVCCHSRGLCHLPCCDPLDCLNMRLRCHTKHQLLTAASEKQLMSASRCVMWWGTGPRACLHWGTSLRTVPMVTV
jgi:hypothetical protein